MPTTLPGEHIRKIATDRASDATPTDPPILTRSVNEGRKRAQSSKRGRLTSRASFAAVHVDSTPGRGSTNQPRASPGECYSMPSPEGAQQTSPGHRPGNAETKPN